jgi:hypothetical protein
MMTGVWANCQLKALIEIVVPFSSTTTQSSGREDGYRSTSAPLSVRMT